MYIHNFLCDGNKQFQIYINEVNDPSNPIEYFISYLYNGLYRGTGRDMKTLKLLYHKNNIYDLSKNYYNNYFIDKGYIYLNSSLCVVRNCELIEIINNSLFITNVEDKSGTPTIRLTKEQVKGKDKQFPPDAGPRCDLMTQTALSLLDNEGNLMKVNLCTCVIKELLMWSFHSPIIYSVSVDDEIFLSKESSVMFIYTKEGSKFLRFLGTDERLLPVVVQSEYDLGGVVSSFPFKKSWIIVTSRCLLIKSDKPLNELDLDT